MAWYYWLLIIVGGLAAAWTAVGFAVRLYVERDTKKEIDGIITPREVYPSQRKEFERWDF